MAAIINLPSSPKISAPADKPQQAQTNSSEQNSGFSQALSQQIEKKQVASSKPDEAGKAPENVDNSVENQSLTQKGSPTESVQTKTAESDASGTDVAVAEETTDTATVAVEAAVIPVQHPGLQELLALRMGMANTESGKELLQAGNTESGKVLPLLASLDGKATTGRSIAELIEARNGPDVAAGAKSQAAVTDEHALLALQQRVQQQLAVPSHSATSVEELKQTLHGVENALKSLSLGKGDQVELKGLEQAREQLTARLQGLQGQNAQSGGGSSAEQQTNAKLPFMNNMNAEEGGKLSELSKLTRVAFQEMLAQQQTGNGQTQATVMTAALSGQSISMNSLSALQSSTGSANPLLNYATSSSSLNLPVSHPGWGQAVGERLQWMVKQDIQQAELKLNPRNMGPIEIKIAMNQDQATVSFVANHAMTREALDAAVPRLREMFGESGLNLVDVNVSQNPDTSGQRASERGDDTGNGRTLASDAGSVDDEFIDDATVAAAQSEQWYGTNSVLDAYA